VHENFESGVHDDKLFLNGTSEETLKKNTSHKIFNTVVNNNDDSSGNNIIDDNYNIDNYNDYFNVSNNNESNSNDNRIISNDNSEKFYQNKKNDNGNSYLGIKLIWVDNKHKRKGVGSCLIDVARKKFLFGNIIEKKNVAFSQPTAEGFCFAKKYLENFVHVPCYV
jgi:hypothetical protein